MIDTRFVNPKENCIFSFLFFLILIVAICQSQVFCFLQVGELTGLLTSDLGSLKDIVSENISRDRGFRALSEASHSILKQK